MNQDNLRKTLVIVATIVTITINVMANVLPINGQNTGEISDRFRVFFVPAGYVFAIWGVIYLGIIAYTIYQALPAQRSNTRLHSAAWWYILGGLANSTWIFLWHYNQFLLSLLVMLVLLVSLIVVYLRLGIGRVAVSGGERWAVFVPISIYLGWVSVATIANVTDVLYDLGWSGVPLDPQVWAVAMLGVALVVGALMAARHADSVFLLVFVWAFAGIGVKQAVYPLVAYGAWVATALAALLALTAPLLKRRFAR